jgi:hypothetical protein
MKSIDPEEDGNLQDLYYLIPLFSAFTQGFQIATAQTHHFLAHSICAIEAWCLCYHVEHNKPKKEKRKKKDGRRLVPPTIVFLFCKLITKTRPRLGYLATRIISIKLGRHPS